MEAQFGPLKAALKQANDSGNVQTAERLRDELQKKTELFQRIKTVILKSVAKKQREQQQKEQLLREQQQRQQQQQGQGQGGQYRQQQAGLGQNQAGLSNANQQPPKPTHPSFPPQSQPQQPHAPPQIQQSSSNNSISGGPAGLTPGAGGLAGPNMGGVGSLGPAFSMSPNLSAAGLAPGPNVNAGALASNRGPDQQHPQPQQPQPQHNRTPSAAAAEIMAFRESLAAHQAQNPSADGRIHNLPPDLMAQMQKLLEHRGMQPPVGQAPNNTLAALLSQIQQHQHDGSGAGGSGGMGGLGGLGVAGQLPVNLTTVNRGNRWTGFVSWSGTDSATQEKKEVRALIVATGVSGSAEMYVVLLPCLPPSFLRRLRSSRTCS